MSHTPDSTPCVGFKPDGPLPVDPYRSLHVHFGMLLGVDDFATLDAYHRGKMWLHNAWLHGPGTIWGLGASLDLEHGEIRVAPGLAIDALGRELHLETDACLNVARWFEQHQEDPDLNVEHLEDGAVRFDAHVVMQFKACLTRQVPALSEPCEGSGKTTAYSRVYETVELLLVPGPAPRLQPPLPYHRLRLLFRLEEPIEEDGVVIDSDQVVIDRREQILGEAAEDQPALYLDAFREFAALDELELRPAAAVADDGQSLFPAVEPAPLVLAELTELTLSAAEDGTLTDGNADNTVRRTLVATGAIQELLCGPLFRSTGLQDGRLRPDVDESVTDGPQGPAPAIGENLRRDAGGPRIDPTSVAVESASLVFRISGDPPSVPSIAAATSISVFDMSAGWSEMPVEDVDFDAKTSAATVHLKKKLPPDATLLRVVVRGTGPFPLIGKNQVPLAGQIDGPPGGQHNGNDFVHMVTIRR